MNSQLGNDQFSISASNGQEVGFVTFTDTDGIVRITSGDENLIEQAGSSNEIASPVIDISLFGPNGDQIKFTGSATICLRINSTQSNEKQCLSFIDTSVNPPEWKCQDECLVQVSPSFWCGETDHFTNFAVLFRGGSNPNDRINECDESSYYIFGVWYWDSLLALLLAATILVIAIVFIVVVINLTPINKIFLGKSQARISSLRKQRRTMTNSVRNP